MKAKLFISFVVLVVMSACSADSTVNTSYPLTGKTIKSVSGKLSSALPRDWFAADGSETGFDLWFIEKDYRASINISSINVLLNKEFDSSEDELLFLLNNSKTVRKAEGSNILSRKNNYTEINSLPVLSYDYINKNKIESRCLIFKLKGSYYEMNTFRFEKSISGNLLEMVQNTILANLK